MYSVCILIYVSIYICIYIATHLHTLYLDWLQAVLRAIQVEPENDDGVNSEIYSEDVIK